MDEIYDGHYMMVDKNGQASVFIHTTPKTPRTETPPFSVRQSGNIGQESLDVDGKVYAWTTDEAKAIHICKLLTAYKNVQDKKQSSGS